MFNFFKKQTNEPSAPAENPYAEKSREMVREINIYSVTLGKKAETIYIKKAALSCYGEDTADYRAEEEAIKTEQKSLHCAIGHYDTMCAEWRNYCKAHDLKIWEVSTSHQVIERHIKSLITRKF